MVCVCGVCVWGGGGGGGGGEKPSEFQEGGISVTDNGTSWLKPAYTLSRLGFVLEYSVISHLSYYE